MATETKKTLHERLRAVQQGLTVSKDGKGRFGSYRTLDGMLEALKPLLKTNELTLTLSNKVEQVGDRNYVVAHADVTDDEGNVDTATAYAWEGDINRGRDAPQVTGAATTYARKYALAGLFAIDDGQGDPDSHKEAAPEVIKETLQTQPLVRKYATANEKIELQALMLAKGLKADDQVSFVQSVLNKPKVETPTDYEEVKAAILEQPDEVTDKDLADPPQVGDPHA